MNGMDDQSLPGVYEALGDAVMVLSDAGMIESANRAAGTSFGYAVALHQRAGHARVL
jgi:hypothetical protein